MVYIFWLGFCIAIGYWSVNRGRSFWFGFLWSFLLSPKAKIEKCPECESKSIVHQAGCSSCSICGWSACTVS